VNAVLLTVVGWVAIDVLIVAGFVAAAEYVRRRRRSP
jgi:hypothetical protein